MTIRNLTEASLPRDLTVRRTAQIKDAQGFGPKIMERDSRKMSIAADDSDEVLAPNAAAAFLGVTPELLFAYSINPPKRASGDDRRLHYVNTPGCCGFRRVDLESFDKYLHEAWSDDPGNRPTLPTYIADYLKVECGGQCARCGRGFKLANAHILPWAESLSHHHHNLIRLCSNCHDEYDATNLISRTEMLALKQQMIASLRSRLAAPARVGVNFRAPTPLLRFVGRDHELGMLVEHFQVHRTMSIEGPGGIGKTQLLIQVLQRLPIELSVLWIDIQSYKNIVDIELAVEAALATYATANGRSLLDKLANLELTLVFDGVEDLLANNSDELADFFQSLITHTKKPRFVFTSQIELHGVDIAKRFIVGPLSREVGMSILQWNSAVHSPRVENDHLEWLASFCEGHPLALTLVRGLLDYFKSAAAVVRRVSQQGAAALAAPTRKLHSPSTSLRACLMVSYQTLTLDQRKCLFLISHSPAGCIDKFLARSPECTLEKLEDDVAVLVRWHLIDREEWAGFWRLHILSPIRAFVLHEWESEPALVKDQLRLNLTISHTIQSVVLCDRHIQKSDARYGVYRFDQEFPNLLYTFRHAVKASSENEAYLQNVVALANSLMVYCFVKGLFDIGVSIMRAGAEAAERLGRVESASTLLVQAISLAGRAHNRHAIHAAVAELDRLAKRHNVPELSGDAAMGRGNLAFAEHSFDEAEIEFVAAESHYRTALGRVEEAAESEQRTDLVRMLAFAVKMQGFVHEKRGDAFAAIKFYEQAREMLVQADDSLNIAATLHQLGNCYTSLGRYEFGFRCYREAANRFLTIPVAEYLSNSLSELGYVVIDWEEAELGLPTISHELLGAGLRDLIDHLMATVNSSAVIPVELHGELLRKTFGMVALASFSENNHPLLAEWALEVRERILRPAIGETYKQTASAMFWMHLDLTLAIAGSISGLSKVKREELNVELAEIQHLAALCYRFYDWGWEAFRVFEWLAAFLRRQRGLANADKDKLKRASSATEEDGIPFTLE